MDLEKLKKEDIVFPKGNVEAPEVRQPPQRFSLGSSNVSPQRHEPPPQAVHQRVNLGSPEENKGGRSGQDPVMQMQREQKEKKTNLVEVLKQALAILNEMLVFRSEDTEDALAEAATTVESLKS